jgi:hypothetical protein
MALEMVPATLLLLAFISGVLLAGYLLFARAWIQYQSEQAVLCAAERRIAFPCGLELKRRLERFLPWGRVDAKVTVLPEKWAVAVAWHLGNFRLQTKRELTPRRLADRRSLKW